jgi:hypothetical protein
LPYNEEEISPKKEDERNKSNKKQMTLSEEMQTKILMRK